MNKFLHREVNQLIQHIIMLSNELVKKKRNVCLFRISLSSLRLMYSYFFSIIKMLYLINFSQSTFLKFVHPRSSIHLRELISSVVSGCLKLKHSDRDASSVYQSLRILKTWMTERISCITYFNYCFCNYYIQYLLKNRIDV